MPARRGAQPRLAAWASDATPSGPFLGVYPKGRGVHDSYLHKL